MQEQAVELSVKLAAEVVVVSVRHDAIDDKPLRIRRVERKGAIPSATMTTPQRVCHAEDVEHLPPCLHCKGTEDLGAKREDERVEDAPFVVCMQHLEERCLTW